MSKTLHSLHDNGPMEHAGRLPRKRSHWWRAITARSCFVPQHTKRLSGPVVAHQVHMETPLAVLELKPWAKRAADGVTEAVRGVHRAQSHTEQGNLLLEKLPQGGCWGSKEAAPRNGRTMKVPSLCLFDPVLGSRGGRVPFESVLLPITHPSAVAQGPSITPSARASCAAEGTKRCVCWAVRTRSSVKEKCSLTPAAVEVAREVAGGGRPRDLLRAQEHPVLNGLPPIGEGGILGPGLLCPDEPVVKKTKSEHAIQRNSLVSGRAPLWATPRMTALVFAPWKPCNRPRIAAVWSAWSDQLLNSRNGSQEGGRPSLRTACTTRFVVALTVSKSFVGLPLGPARTWWRRWRRGRYLVGSCATKRGLSGAMCLS